MIGRDFEDQKKSFSLKGVEQIKRDFLPYLSKRLLINMTPLRLNDFFWFSESRPIILLRQFETTMLLPLVSN